MSKPKEFPPKIWTHLIKSTQELAVWIDGPMCGFRPIGATEYISLAEHDAAMRAALKQDMELREAVKSAEGHGLRPEIAFAVYHTKRKYKALLAAKVDEARREAFTYCARHIDPLGLMPTAKHFLAKASEGTRDE